MAKSHTKFFRRKEQIIEDAEYALAKATNLMKSRRATDAMQEQREEQQELDQEIEKLKRELNEIEE